MLTAPVVFVCAAEAEKLAAIEKETMDIDLVHLKAGKLPSNPAISCKIPRSCYLVVRSLQARARPRRRGYSCKAAARGLSSQRSSSSRSDSPTSSLSVQLSLASNFALRWLTSCYRADVQTGVAEPLQELHVVRIISKHSHGAHSKLIACALFW
jgi:hypothetical protein